MTRRKKKSALPKVRHTWKIKPHTRVKPSEKLYRRPQERKKAKNWVDDVSWFGEL